MRAAVVAILFSTAACINENCGTKNIIDFMADTFPILGGPGDNSFAERSFVPGDDVRHMTNEVDQRSCP
jgi:hypothetical protein